MPDVETSKTVGEWVTEHPQTARVFEELRVDYCCGGGVPLAEACASRNLDIQQVLAQLATAAENRPSDSDDDWAQSPLADLCDHIEQTHHAYLRDQLPRLTELVRKVVDAHSDRHANLRELAPVFAALRGELEPHMMKEEQILFPAIRQLEQAASRPNFPFGSVANPIRMMEHEHGAAGNGLVRIRQLLDDFRVPEDACNTYRVMLDSLQELEQDLHRHIHKENNILFPRAEALEGRSLGAPT